jgi:type III restriction enzyme
MELKNYQKKVLEDLKNYLNKIIETTDYEQAYNLLWKEKGITVGSRIFPKYNNEIKNTPHICFKVPTGGGKTYLAANAIKPIFDVMPSAKTKTVAWLVPSDAILEQTTKNLTNPDHPYRQALSRDFGGRVEIYTKQQLLNGQNFNPTSVYEQLSIFVLSYDSIRSSKKDGRKIYQENGNLAAFPKIYTHPETLLKDIDDTALIQVINQLSPLVIVDESHHAVSDLSIEMLNNLNPSFVIDLTATPKTNSNIISYVDSIELKRENMVKLPLIAYNRKSKEDVLIDAVDLRNKLETFAKQETEYIRPIVLFQAEPKGKEDSQTFEKLKNDLIEIGIPKEQIAIKTANINEIKNIDLLSKKCEIRYIITINALKEGWDCPFAYILATLANRSSKIDVEQIVGRILRQPYTKQHKNEFLNLSYVFTSSNSFSETADNIIKGLNNAGFSDKDYRLALDDENEKQEGQNTFTSFGGGTEDPNSEDSFSFDTRTVKTELQQREGEQKDHSGGNLTDILTAAQTENQGYEQKAAQNAQYSGDMLSAELRDKMPKSEINTQFKKELTEFSLPQFYKKENPSIFSAGGKVLLTKENLGKDFSLKGKSAEIDFNRIDDEIGKIDINENASVPKFIKLSEPDIKYFKQTFSEVPHESKVRSAKKALHEKLNTLDNIESSDLERYLDHIINDLTPDQLTELQNHTNLYSDKIKKHIEDLLQEYRFENFKRASDSGKIVCEDSFKLKPELSIQEGVTTLAKSLYTIEGKMNDFERKVIEDVASVDNVLWWHRNIEKQEFFINGFINHYPDFIVKTKSGKIILIETKGDWLENRDSQLKAKIGSIWQNKAGDNYLYYMVYENKTSEAEGVYSFSEFKNIIREI